MQFANLGDVIHEAIKETEVAFFNKDIGIQAGPSVTTNPGENYLPPQADVTAIIAFNGTIEGGVHLSAPFHCAVALASAFSGEEIPFFNDTAKDAIGELANIIAGAVRIRLCEDRIQLTPPRIVVGRDHQIGHSKPQSATRCYFRTNEGPFLVEVFFSH
ncbi:Chemotaxis protein CheX [Candidatus Magnetaquicoccaceae bacterium FCR-1]|uniref:Chemotaxis protein CheX n=1 Tax=Candidatus Magnetaquiglobus chichijimensis TaxID=3141448 RepID=A0ABQ0CB00_9PROT